jgi:hypothetical protein
MAIKIQLNDQSFRPGQMLQGHVQWEFDSLPSKLVLSIDWRTSGKGTEDSETVFNDEWSPDTQCGKREFQFQLPRGPISVFGTLIQIGWQVECSCKRPSDSATASFVLSPLQHAIQLSTGIL